MSCMFWKVGADKFWLGGGGWGCVVVHSQLRDNECRRAGMIALTAVMVFEGVAHFQGGV
jgi:hypothetical protein